MIYTVLIIDGQETERKLLAHSLKNRLGYRIVGCADTHEAAGYFGSSFIPDLVLLDWATAGGSDAVAQLKRLSAGLPIVVLVKYGDYDAGTEALNAGAQDFLTKPVALERVGTTFHNLLLLRDACREVERLRSQTVPCGGPGDEMVSLLPLVLLGDDGNIRPMGEIEAEAIRFAMQYYHGRMTEVAKRLGIGRSTLYRKLSELEANQEKVA